MGEKIKVFHLYMERCERLLCSRLDLDNVNWIHDLPEYERIMATIKHCVTPFKYAQEVNVGGVIISPALYWDVLKGLEYSPEIAAAYERHKKSLFHLSWRARGVPINDPLITAIYDIALSQDGGQGGPARKYPTDELILTEGDKARRQQAVKASRARRAAQAAAIGPDQRREGQQPGMISEAATAAQDGHGGPT